MNCIFTASEAREWAARDQLEDWVHFFLQGEGNNLPFSDGLKLVPRHYRGPRNFHLARLVRCCGPEAGMKYPVPREGFEDRVGRIGARLASGWDMPPLIVSWSAGRFELNDGNHRHEALVRAGRTSHPVIFWITAGEDLAAFEAAAASAIDD